MALRAPISPFLRHTCTVRASILPRLRFSTSSPQRLDVAETLSSPTDAAVLGDAASRASGSDPVRKPKNRLRKSKTTPVVESSIETLMTLTETSSATPTELSPGTVPSPIISHIRAPVILAQLPYHVSRTPSNNLPVYTDIRNGKTRKETIVRKIAGDPKKLRDDLVQYLAIDEERVWVGKVTAHVYMKGHHKTKVEQFLAERGF